MKDHMQRLAQTVGLAQEIQNIKDDLEELPAKVRQLESEFEAVEAQYQQKKSALEKAESEAKRHKSDIEGDATTLKVKEERLHTIKTTKEYQAVLKEIATGKTSVKDREAAIVKYLGEAEGLKSEVAPLESRRQELNSSLQDERSQIKDRLDELSQKLGLLEIQLNEQLSSLPEDIRHKYLRIQGKRQPPAAKLSEGTCQECFMSVPPQLYIEIRKTFEIHSCPNCHRLLFLDL